MATESLDKFFNASRDATSIVHTLNQMSWAMYESGNERMGERLEFLASDLKLDIAQMYEAYGEAMTGWSNSVNESTGNILRLAMGMSGLMPSENVEEG